MQTKWNYNEVQRTLEHDGQPLFKLINNDKTASLDETQTREQNNFGDKIAQTLNSANVVPSDVIQKRAASASSVRS